MITKPEVVLDTRDYIEIYSEILTRRAAYVEEWQAPESPRLVSR